MKVAWYLTILAQHFLVNMYSFFPAKSAVTVSCLTGSNHTTVVLNNQSMELWVGAMAVLVSKERLMSADDEPMVPELVR